MEEIKLPKFNTKEELEQFAMGLMTEYESLKEFLEDANRRAYLLISTLWRKADKETKDSCRMEYFIFSTSWGDWHERFCDNSKLTHEELLSKLHHLEDELIFTKKSIHILFSNFKNKHPEAYEELYSIAKNMTSNDWNNSL